MELAPLRHPSGPGAHSPLHIKYEDYFSTFVCDCLGDNEVLIAVYLRGASEGALSDGLFC